MDVIKKSYVNRGELFPNSRFKGCVRSLGFGGFFTEAGAMAKFFVFPGDDANEGPVVRRAFFPEHFINW